MEFLTFATNLVRALFIGFCGILVCRWLVTHNFKFLKLSGRMNRLEFFCWLISLYTISHLFNALFANLMNQVINEPGYWTLKIFAYTVYILLTPFYLAMYARRFQDLSIPALAGIITTLLIIFSVPYEVVKLWSFVFTVIIGVINFFLLIIPGTNGRNPYGNRSNWPQKNLVNESGRIQKRV